MTTQGEGIVSCASNNAPEGFRAGRLQGRAQTPPPDNLHYALRHHDIVSSEAGFRQPSSVHGASAFRPGNLIHDFMMEEGLLEQPGLSQALPAPTAGSLQPSFAALSAGLTAPSQSLSLETDDDFLAGLTFTLPPFQMPHTELPDVDGGFAGLPVHAAARDFESLPAELPSHVVDRLLRHGPGSALVPLDSVKCSEGLVALSKPLVRTLSAPVLADLDDLLMGPSQPTLPPPMPLHHHHHPPPLQSVQAPRSPKKHLLMDPSELRAFAATADIKSLHNVYLTPHHKRKGKGGRQPAEDPRLDPNMDPKRAKRILNNRLSAARSKAKQKSAQDGASKKVDNLEQQRNKLRQEMRSLKASCSEQAASNEQLEHQLQAARHQQHQERMAAARQLHSLPAGPPPSVFAGHQVAGDHASGDQGPQHSGSQHHWLSPASSDPALGHGSKGARLVETPSHLQLLRDLGLPVTRSSEQLALNLSGSLTGGSGLMGGNPHAFAGSMSSAEQLAHLWPSPSGTLKGSMS